MESNLCSQRLSDDVTRSGETNNEIDKRGRIVYNIRVCVCVHLKHEARTPHECSRQLGKQNSYYTQLTHSISTKPTTVLLNESR